MAVWSGQVAKNIFFFRTTVVVPSIFMVGFEKKKKKRKEEKNRTDYPTNVASVNLVVGLL